jgi:long-chain fatty acid transport protein
MKPLRFVLACAVLLICSTAFAGGFLIYEHGARATGMADARTALADDVNALYFNPAAITELEGVHLQLGVTGIIPFTSYTPSIPDEYRTYTQFATGDVIEIREDGAPEYATDAKVKAYSPIHLYASYKIPADIGLSVGLGVNNPFGLGTFWPGDFAGRFIGSETEIQTFFTQPVVAFDIAEVAGFKDTFKLSIAAGYNFVYGTAKLTKHIDLRVAEMLSPVVGPEGLMRMTGSAIGHGWNVALHGELPGWFSFGASIRSGVSLPFSGTAKFSFNDAAQQAIQTLNLNIPEETSGDVTIDLPLNMNFGVAFLGVEKLKIALDFYIAFFTSFDEIDLKFACLDEDPPCSTKQDPIQKHWGNAAQISLGAEYEVIDGLQLRAGYGMVFGLFDGEYADSPAPADTYDPSLPDGRRDLICFGVGYGMDWWKFDVGYMLAMWSGTKDNDVGGADSSGNPNGKANGDYDSTVHLIALSLSAMF